MPLTDSDVEKLHSIYLYQFGFYLLAFGDEFYGPDWPQTPFVAEDDFEL